MTEPELHPALEAIAWLLGTWQGEGKGIYPTIDSFTYREETRFWHTGRPVMAYAQRTWLLDSGMPAHSEMGFFRPQRDGSIEVVLTHSFGVVEISHGAVDGRSIAVETTSLSSTPSAKTIEGLKRLYELNGDSLRYEVDMAFGGQRLQNHLEAELTRS